MTKTTRARYTLEFKQEAVRLVEGGQSIAAAARTLGAVDQTLFNWVKVSIEVKSRPLCTQDPCRVRTNCAPPAPFAQANAPPCVGAKTQAPSPVDQSGATPPLGHAGGQSFSESLLRATLLASRVWTAPGAGLLGAA